MQRMVCPLDSAPGEGISQDGRDLIDRIPRGCEQARQSHEIVKHAGIAALDDGHTRSVQSLGVRPALVGEYVILGNDDLGRWQATLPPALSPATARRVGSPRKEEA